MFTDENGLDMNKIMHHYAQMNPHISLSDIAFLMDVPYQPEPDSYATLEATESIN
ncbi:hypothetical protein JYT48_03095 [Mariprofundus ferrooxydans]|nr:hypothetical protein [Mariprofundus ferrooxydans]